MATGRRVTSAPGTVRIGGIGRGTVQPIPTEPFADIGDMADGTPATERFVGRPEFVDSRIVPLGDLGLTESVVLTFKQPFDRLRVVQRTASVTLALGYGRVPTATDFDDLIVGAIYFDFPTPSTRDLTILNMGTVALASDLLVIAMTGERFETV